METKDYVIIGTVLFVALAVISLILIIHSHESQTENGVQHIEDFQPPAYIIDGDLVYINDSNAYISAYPKTSVGWTTFSVLSKQYTGNIDLVFMFDTDTYKPTQAKLKRLVPENKTNTYTCDYEFNYTTSPKHFWCYWTEIKNDTEYPHIVYQHDFDGGNLPSKTAWWYTDEWWTNVDASAFDKQAIDFNGLDVAYIKKNYVIEAGVQRDFQIFLQPKAINVKGAKYWFCTKPSGETISKARDSGHLYCLDPWTTDLNEGLVVYWNMDNDTNPNIVEDEVQNTINCTMFGGPIWIPGKIGDALDFDGINDKLQCNGTGSDADLDFTANGTIALWGNLQTDSRGSWIAKGWGIYAHWDFALYNNDQLYWQWYDGAWDSVVIDNYFVDESFDFYVVTWAGDNMSIYNNNTLISTTIDSTMYTNSSSYIQMMHMVAAGNNDYLDGIIDEVGIWNETLTPSQITALWNGGAGLTYVGEVIPTVTINYPTAIIYNASVTQLNYTVDAAEYCWYSLDNATTNSSRVTAGTNWSSLSSSAGYNTWTVYCNNTDDNIGFDNVTFYLNSTVATSLVSPDDEANLTNANVGFEWNSSSIGANLVNTTFHLWYDNGTNYNTTTYTVTGTNNQTEINITLPQDSYIWNAESCVASSCAFDTNRTFLIHITNPSVELHYPNTTFDYFVLGNNLTLNWTPIETGEDLSVHIANCSYTYDGVTVNLDTSDCLLNQTTFLYSLGVNNLTFNITDIYGLTAYNTTQWDFVIIETDVNYSSTVSSTSAQTFSIDLLTNGTAAIYDTFVYNSVSSASTNTSLGGNYYHFTANKTVPATTGTYSFYWNFTLGGTTYNTTSYDQTVTGITFGLCNSTLNITYLNISFRNETLAEEYVTSTIDSDWTYSITGGTGETSSYSYTNTTENSNYAFCFSPTDTNISVNFTLDYYNSYSAQRSYIGDLDLTSTTTQLELYLLPTSEGVYVSFQVINSAEQPLSGVAVNVTDAGTLIESDQTDDAGLVTFFLDPDKTYTFSFYKSGYDVYTTSLQPSQTTFTVTLGGGTVTLEDYTKGISYTIKPTTRTLVNNTAYDFNITLTSTYWTVNNFGFTLYNSSGSELGNGNLAANGGTVNVNLNTNNLSFIRMDYYWNITGNLTNASTYWYVEDSTGKGWGIANFITRLNLYIDNGGIFGLDAFGVTIIIFLFIFITTGIISYKYGFNNAIIIATIVFIQVAFFQVVLGFIENPPFVSTDLPLATFFMAFILVGLIVKENIG